MLCKYNPQMYNTYNSVPILCAVEWSFKLTRKAGNTDKSDAMSSIAARYIVVSVVESSER